MFVDCCFSIPAFVSWRQKLPENAQPSKGVRFFLFLIMTPGWAPCMYFAGGCWWLVASGFVPTATICCPTRAKQGAECSHEALHDRFFTGVDINQSAPGRQDVKQGHHGAPN